MRTRSLVGPILVGFVVVSAIAELAAAQPAAAFRKGDSTIGFAFKIQASTHVQKLDQTITPPPGTFKGQIDIEQQRLSGSIKLPPATFTMDLAGALPLVTGTAQIVQAKPVTGTINFKTLLVRATATFNIRLTNLSPALVPVNLVGNTCRTATPVRVTMTGTANLAGKSTFSGTFTIPPFAGCGTGTTTAINQLIPGPGNTFTATATP